MAVLLILSHRNLQTRLIHTTLFVLIALIPLGIWAIRNQILSGALFGPRTPSTYTLSQNVVFTFGTVALWYLPSKALLVRGYLLIKPYILLILLGLATAAAVFFVTIGLKEIYVRAKAILLKMKPVVLFILVYTIFLIFSSTIAAFDRIGTRLLSPIDIPVILLVVVSVASVLGIFQKTFAPKTITILTGAIFGLWLLCFPVRFFISNVADYMSQGAGGYSTTAWRDSETIWYLQQHALQPGHVVYSNEVSALYILVNLTSEPSPMKTVDLVTHSLTEPSTLQNHWPKSDSAYLIWFDDLHLDYQFTPEDLNRIANVEQKSFRVTPAELQTNMNLQRLAHLGDGSIYFVTKRH